LWSGLILTDATKISNAFREWAGSDQLLSAAEFKSALNTADKNNDGKLDRSEFATLATRLGLTSSEADTAFNTARGSGPDIDINDLLTTANSENTTKDTWTEAEFKSFLDSTTTPSTASTIPSADAASIPHNHGMSAVANKDITRRDGEASHSEFDTMAAILGTGSKSPPKFAGLAANGVITLAELSGLYTAVDASKDGSLDAAEFRTLSVSLGVDSTSDAKFKSIAGVDLNLSNAELTGYSNPFGATASGSPTWSEAQFNSFVADLKG
jgi:Ca2+-binding EF-hand superfamily protein